MMLWFNYRIKELRGQATVIGDRLVQGHMVVMAYGRANLGNTNNRTQWPFDLPLPWQCPPSESQKMTGSALCFIRSKEMFVLVPLARQ